MSAEAVRPPVAHHGAPQSIPLEQIQPSPTNPRKHFDQDQLDELTASVEKHGVLQPILVRPVVGEAWKYELVAGERRYRAAHGAGLEEIPVLVRELSDREVLEVQVIENLQRADLHPLEEAEGYEKLIHLPGENVTVDELAAKVGKSRAYIYARMKLCALVPKAREAFYEGKLTPSTALLIARIPVPSLQEQAVQEITRPRGGWPYGEPDAEEPIRRAPRSSASMAAARLDVMSFREAAEHIQDNYMLALGGAPFDKADVELVPGAGPCTTCPKRTGNQAELFDDINSADLCTDPSCFSKKKAAAWDQRKAEAERRGQLVVPEKKKGSLFNTWDNRLKHGSAYVDLNERCDIDPKKRAWRAVLGKDAPTVTIARDNLDKVHELVARAAAEAVLTKKLPKLKEQLVSNEGETQRQREEAQRLKERQAQRGILLDLVMADLVEATQKKAPDKRFWRLLAGVLWSASSMSSDGVDLLCQRRLIDRMTAKKLDAFLDGLSESELRGIVLELAIVGDYDWQHAFSRGDKGGSVADACRVLGVDVKKLEPVAKRRFEATKTPTPDANPSAKKTKKK